MAFIKKEWTDRVAEFINRRRLTFEDGSSQLVTVSREEGDVSEEGDAFSAENMNELEERIENEFTALNSKLSTVSSGANKITITRKTGTFTATGTHMIDLGAKKNIFGLSAFITNGAIPIPCAIQGQRHLRFNMQPVTTVECEVNYEYFEYSII